MQKHIYKYECNWLSLIKVGPFSFASPNYSGFADISYGNILPLGFSYINPRGRTLQISKEFLSDSSKVFIVLSFSSIQVIGEVKTNKTGSMICITFVIQYYRGKNYAKNRSSAH